MSIITQGYGASQSLVTQGYGIWKTVKKTIEKMAVTIKKIRGFIISGKILDRTIIKDVSVR